MPIVACGFCNHPGSHAQCIPLSSGPAKRCGDCLTCRTEEREQQSNRLEE
jgi:hypothetical protein